MVPLRELLIGGAVGLIVPTVIFHFVDRTPINLIYCWIVCFCAGFLCGYLDVSWFLKRR